MKPSKAAGFTLIEVLIVLVVISIMIAIALPVFSRAREKGRSATCQSNLKQIALAMQQYVQDHDGWYPSAGIIGTDQKQWASHIRPYVRNTQILLCPTREALGGGNSLNGSRALNYDYNVLRLNHFSFRSLMGSSEAAVVYSSKVWINADGDFSEDTLSGPSACGDWWWTQWGQEIHSGGANYSFVDGHVKWLTRQQIEEIECSLGAPQFRIS